ncbi:MAG: HU family DNA-binding protein [Candidatus Harrisonbacteria bacterium]|nr:HU family DNA-binding protein [Candidatus Harrisonbacteria bacterium]
MKKAELAEALVQALGLETKKKGVETVDALVDIVTKAMSRGEEVSIPGFGVWRVVKRAARMGVNPKTGEKIQIAGSDNAGVSSGYSEEERRCDFKNWAYPEGLRDYFAQHKACRGSCSHRAPATEA